MGICHSKKIKIKTISKFNQTNCYHLPPLKCLNRQKGYYWAYDGTAIKKYDFTKICRLPVDAAVGCFRNSYIFIAGGSQNQSQFCQNVYAVDTDKLVVMKAKDLPYASKEGVLLEHQNKLYFIGGVRLGKNTGQIKSNPLMKFYVDQNNWEVIDRLSVITEYGDFRLKKLFYTGAVIFREKIFIVGGYFLKNRERIVNQKFFSIDLQSFQVQEEKIKISLNLIKPICMAGETGIILTCGYTLRQQKKRRNQKAFRIDTDKGICYQIYGFPIDIKENPTVLYWEKSPYIVCWPKIVGSLKQTQWVIHNANSIRKQRAKQKLSMLQNSSFENQIMLNSIINLQGLQQEDYFCEEISSSQEGNSLSSEMEGSLQEILEQRPEKSKIVNSEEKWCQELSSQKHSQENKLSYLYQNSKFYLDEMKKISYCQIISPKTPRFDFDDDFLLELDSSQMSDYQTPLKKPKERSNFSFEIIKKLELDQYPKPPILKPPNLDSYSFIEEQSQIPQFGAVYTSTITYSSTENYEGSQTFKFDVSTDRNQSRISQSSETTNKLPQESSVLLNSANRIGIRVNQAFQQSERVDNLFLPPLKPKYNPKLLGQQYQISDHSQGFDKTSDSQMTLGVNLSQIPIFINDQQEKVGYDQEKSPKIEKQQQLITDLNQQILGHRKLELKKKSLPKEEEKIFGKISQKSQNIRNYGKKIIRQSEGKFQNEIKGISERNSRAIPDQFSFKIDNQIECGGIFSLRDCQNFPDNISLYFDQEYIQASYLCKYLNQKELKLDELGQILSVFLVKNIIKSKIQ